MAAIGPNIVASVLQSGVAQVEQAKADDAAKNAQADESRRAGMGADSILEIESTDGDTKVHADAGGAGGQGRYDAPSEGEALVDEADDDKGKTPKPPQHIDLSA